ncbi:MAG: 4'-phosphopantetheinyl transferase superfamily protein [Calothrix sp. C42_A2020_038]|nr:4'-phosphopantetheinyl transferase superfamily protein [Calothrix sp. C42_A2020_038]
MQNSKLRTLVTDNNSQWLSAPAELTLLQDEIHVWRMELDQPESKLQQFAKLLSEDELSRAERLYFQQHRQRFTAGRGILRTILSRYLNITPNELQFSYEAFGKPVLAEQFKDSQLWFNLSHCQGMALCAVCLNRPIGIDLEYIRPVTDVLVLAQQFFSPNEYAVMKSLPPNQKQEVFFRYWTCKEAYLKATGAGISQLQQIEVSLSSNEGAKLNTVSDWSLLELVPARGSVAAIAVPGAKGYLKRWQFN